MAIEKKSLSPDARALLDRGNVGRSEPVAGFPAAPVTLINVEGADDKGAMVTVYLDPPILENRDEGTIDTIPLAVPVGVAIVQWGNGGFQHEAEVDFARGCAFSLACSYLRVIARVDGTSVTIRLGATVAYGTRPGPLRGPSRTIPFTPDPIPVGGASDRALIPPFARSGTVLVTPVAVPAVQSRLRVETYATASIADFVATINDLWRIPVPVNAYVARFFNGEAVPVRAAMQWDLAL